MVQVIPVIVGDEQTVEGRKVARRDGSCPGKGPCAEGDRRGMIAEHRVDEKFLSAELEKKAGMTEPDHRVSCGGKSGEVGRAGRHGTRGGGVGLLFHEGTDERSGKAAAVAEHGPGNEIAELSVDIVRREENAPHILPFGQRPELLLPEKSQRSSGSGNDGAPASMPRKERRFIVRPLPLRAD